jgi:hypothetical protein
MRRAAHKRSRVRHFNEVGGYISPPSAYAAEMAPWISDIARSPETGQHARRRLFRNRCHLAGRPGLACGTYRFGAVIAGVNNTRGAGVGWTFGNRLRQ